MACKITLKNMTSRVRRLSRIQADIHTTHKYLHMGEWGREGDDSPSCSTSTRTAYIMYSTLVKTQTIRTFFLKVPTIELWKLLCGLTTSGLNAARVPAPKWFCHELSQGKGHCMEFAEEIHASDSKARQPLPRVHTPAQCLGYLYANTNTMTQILRTLALDARNRKHLKNERECYTQDMAHARQRYTWRVTG
jgi:hypothetical protein